MRETACVTITASRGEKKKNQTAYYYNRPDSK